MLEAAIPTIDIPRQRLSCSVTFKRVPIASLSVAINPMSPA